MIIALALVAPSTVLAQTPLIDIGVWHGNAINNSGQVALDGSAGGAVYSSGTMTLLPALPPGTAPAAALAINDSGAVAGGANGGAQQPCVAILYSGGTLTDIGVPFGTPGPFDCAAATGINTGGVVAGWSSHEPFASGIQHFGFIYDNNAGTLTQISGSNRFDPLVPPYAAAYGINDSGQVTGEASFDIAQPGNISFDRRDAFIYLNGTLTDLGPGTGYAINNRGEVAGAATIDLGGGLYRTHAFIYTGGKTVDLGTLPGGTNAQGLAINSTGQIVGSSDLSGTTGSHAFFYNGVLADLNAVISATDPLKAFVTLQDATGINDSRLIVTNGMDSRDRQTHAYLLQGPWIDIAPGPLAFPSEATGNVSPGQSITVTNSGTAAVSLGTPGISGDFAQTNDCGASLPAKAACTIQVNFAPTASGDRVGALTFTSNAVPFAVPLSGTAAISATISANPTTVITGTPTKLTWTISAGTTCTATGGVSGDGWSGAITARGSQSVTEKTAGTYNYGLSCTAGSQSAHATAAVTVTSPAAPQPAKTGGGDGALDSLALVVLMTLAGLRTARRERSDGVHAVSVQDAGSSAAPPGSQMLTRQTPGCDLRSNPYENY